MIIIKALEVLDYYDVPILFIAENISNSKYLICSFVNIDSSGILYIATEIDTQQLERIKYKRAKIEQFFKNANSVYKFHVNNGSSKKISARILTDNVSSYLPSPGYYIDPVEDFCANTGSKYYSKSIGIKIEATINYQEIKPLCETLYEDFLIEIPIYVNSQRAKKEDEVSYEYNSEESQSCQKRTLAA